MRFVLMLLVSLFGLWLLVFGALEINKAPRTEGQGRCCLGAYLNRMTQILKRVYSPQIRNMRPKDLDD